MSVVAVKSRSATRVVTHSPHGQPSARLRYLKIAVASALATGLLLSPNLWLSHRSFPLTPVVSLFRPLPSPLDLLVYLGLLTALLGIAVINKPAKLIFIVVVSAVFLACSDQERLQPWFYQYVFMLAAIGLYGQHQASLQGNRDNSSLNLCRLIVACIYFWSGLSKANAPFMFNFFPWMVESFARFLPHSMLNIMKFGGIAAPLVEALIGVGLLTRRFRKYSIFAAIGMHAFILLTIGPFTRDYNRIVWPWNIAMVCFLFILFWRQPEFSARQILLPQPGIFPKIVLIAFGIAPVLSFFNLWDQELSFALYAPMRNEQLIYITNPLADRLPKEILKYVYLSKQPGINNVNLHEWAFDTLNVPAYPEPREYKNLARYLCTYARQPADLRLTIWQSSPLMTERREFSYTCAQLVK